MATIPGTRIPRWYTKKWIGEAISIVPITITGAVTAYTNIIDPTKWVLGYAVAGSLVFLIVAQCIKVMQAHSDDAARNQLGEHDGLRAALRIVHQSLCQHLEVPENERNTSRIRATIHRVVVPDAPHDTPEMLEQLIDYVGGQGGRAGRRFSIRSGIVGKVARENAVLTAKRHNTDHEAYIKELVNEWAYTEADARRLRSDRKSWMAVPITNKNNAVIAVVFLDSRDEDTFTESVKELMVLLSLGISSYVNERYD